MNRREGPADQLDDAARDAYTAALDGKQRKGVQIYERPHLWDEEKPCSFADTPTDNFIPTPTISTGDSFKSFSLPKKIAIITLLAAVGVLVLVCGASFFADYF